MKRIITTCFVLFSITIANAQPHALTFTMAVSADKSLTQQDLYKRGKFWFSNVFNSSNKTLTLDDPSQGIIVGTGSFAYESKVIASSAKTKGTIKYQVKLRFKEGRYEYEITNFKHTGSGISFGLITQDATCSKEIPDVSPEWKKEVWDDMKSQAEANSKAIIKSLISEISKVDYGN